MEFAFITTIILGTISILLSITKDRERKLFIEEEKKQKDKLNKISILKDIQNKTSYITDTEKAVELIMEALRKFFIYSTASSLVVRENSLIFKTHIEEAISMEYIKNIKKNMLSSLSELGRTIPAQVDEITYGVSLNNSGRLTYASSFHIPLIVNNKVLAIIHLSSIKEGMYKDKDMEILYQIIEQVSNSLSGFNKILKTEKDKYVSLIKSIKDGIFMVDNKNNLLLINDAAKKILGLTKEDITLFNITSVFPKNLDLYSKINESISANKSFEEKEIKISEKTINLYINPLEENLTSVIIKNITEDKNAAILREDFLHVMVHELRAPITTIKDSAELIITTRDRLEEEKVLKFLEIIHNQSKTVLEQISEILDTAKLDAGRFTIQKKEGDIGKLIGDEIQAFTPKAMGKHISLKYNILKSLPLIYFDPLRIIQIVNNLISNSLKFTPEGGEVNIEVDYRPIPPDLNNSSNPDQLLSLDKFIVVSVSDTGIGIPFEQQKYLFSKFSQIKTAPEKLTKLGSGLGLYIVKGIVEAHGGKVWVNSEWGKGTKVTFILPAQGTKLNITPQEPPTSTLSSFGKTVN